MSRMIRLVAMVLIFALAQPAAAFAQSAQTESAPGLSEVTTSEPGQSEPGQSEPGQPEQPELSDPGQSESDQTEPGLSELVPTEFDQSELDATASAEPNEEVIAVPQEFGGVEIVEVKPVHVVTFAGTAPILPEKVEVVYSDGNIGQLNVVWPPIDLSLYAVPGSFTIEGLVEGTNLKASANIMVIASSGDVNGDGKVSVGDLSLVARYYGKNTGSVDWQEALIADVNHDGAVDLEDLVIVANEIFAKRK